MSLNNISNKWNVLVLSRYWPTALGVIRSLGAAGYTVDYMVSSPQKGAANIAASSKYVRNYVETVWKSVKRSDDPLLLSNLLEYAKTTEVRAVLFPTDDYTAFFIDRHRAVLMQYFILPHTSSNSSYSVTQLMDKAKQMQIAEGAGIEVPKTWTVFLGETVSIPNDMIYPCFCKPQKSISGFKGEMAKCNDCDELQKHLEFLQERESERNVLIQEFVDIDYEIDLSGVCLRDRVIIPGLIKKTFVAQHEKGVTVGGTILPLSSIGTSQEKVIDMLKALGYTGMFDMELYVEGQNIYFGEINLRSGGPNYSYFLSGVNLPALFVKGILGDEIDIEETKIKEFEKTFVNEYVAWKEYFHGELRLKQIIKALYYTDYKLISSSDDTEPIKAFKRQTKKELYKKIRNKLMLVRTKIIKKLIAPLLEFAKGYPQRRLLHTKRRRSGEISAIVFGRNYSSNLCMVRALGMAGYEVEVIRLTSKRQRVRDIVRQNIPEAYSKYTKAFYTCSQAKNGKEVFEKLLEIADTSQKKFLFPTDDVSAYFSDQYYNELKDLYYLPDIDKQGGNIIAMMDKSRQKKLALECGVNVSAGNLIRIKDGEYNIPADIRYPCFIKPNVSRRTSKKRMKVCNTRYELEEELNSIAAETDLDLLVEENIQIKREISLLGISCSGNAFCAGGFIPEISGNDSRRGVSAKGKMISHKASDEIFEKIKPIFVAMNYTGLFGVDLLESKNGEIFFIEINFRYGASGYTITKNGVNLPQMMVSYMKDGKMPCDELIKTDKCCGFVSEKVLLEEYEEGFIDAKTVKRIIEDAEILFVKDDKDEKPFRQLMKNYKELI